MRLLLATKNLGKLKEYQAFLGRMPFSLVTVDQVPSVAKLIVKETGSTFLANSRLKAVFYGQHSGLLTLADDSGLCIDALAGFPGIRSARFAHGDFVAAQKKLLAKLNNLPLSKRTAYFQVVISLFDPQTNLLKSFSGLTRGRIVKPLGNNGFGYDPIFFADKLGKTYAQAGSRQKNRYSHRAKAFNQLKRFLTDRYIKSQ